MARARTNQGSVTTTDAGITELEDHQLLQRVAQGDRTAFWVVWERYRQHLLSRHSLLFMDGNHADAEDALSDISIQVLQHLLESKDEIRHVKNWLKRVLYNHCMMTWRTHRRQAECLASVTDMGRQQTALTLDESAEESVLRKELADAIQQAIKALPPRLRHVARLRFVQELSYQEIANRLHICQANARKRVQQARPLLQASLRVYGADSVRAPAALATFPTGFAGVRRADKQQTTWEKP